MFPCNLKREIKLKCEFYDDKFYGYTCVLDEIKLISRTDNLLIDTTSNEKSNEEVESVIIRNSHLSFVPNQLFNIFPNVKRFYANENNLNLKELQPSDFKGAQNLKGLYLDNNEINTLPDSIFQEAPNLINLLLSKNPIKIIEDFAFYGLENLIVLELSDILVEVVTKNTFGGLKELKFLFLENHRIRIVQRGAFDHNRNLSKLYAQDISILQNQKETVRGELARATEATRKASERFATEEDSIQKITRAETEAAKLIMQASPGLFRTIASAEPRAIQRIGKYADDLIEYAQSIKAEIAPKKKAT